MSLLMFDNDEDGYLRWLHDNPRGFVINAPKSRSGADMLHRATCGFVSSRRRTNYTTTSYKKVCSLEKQELIDWANRYSSDFRLCSFCRPASTALRSNEQAPLQKMTSPSRATLSDSDFQRLVIRCRGLPPAKGNYLVHDYVENLLITVLDFQMYVTTVERAIEHYRRHAKAEIKDFTALKSLLARYSDTQEENRQLAQYLWGYNHWTRVELLRRLVAYFEAQGVTTQEQLKLWAATANFERDFKGRVKGAGLAIFQWLVMRQGVETVKPDVWVHRFIQDVLGYSISDEMAVESLERVAHVMGVKAYELDWRIWEYQSGRSGALEPVRPTAVAFRSKMIWVALADGRVIGAPLARYPWLESATEAQRNDYRIGAFSILWEALEDGIDIEGLLSSVPLPTNDLT